jgi:hypothetical protein
MEMYATERISKSSEKIALELNLTDYRWTYVAIYEHNKRYNPPQFDA